MPLAELPQTNKQHAVPQNIMDVEFKLIGDLTLRQFAYLIIFGGVSYLCFVLVIGIFKLPLALFFALFGLSLAFIPVQDRGLDEWVVSFFRAIFGPSQRVWRKDPQIPSAFMYENLNVVKQELIALAPTSSRRKLEEYLHFHITDTRVDPLDIPEQEYIKKVHDAYYVVPSLDSQLSDVSVPTVGSSVADIGIAALPPSTPVEVPMSEDIVSAVPSVSGDLLTPLVTDSPTVSVSITPVEQVPSSVETIPSTSINTEPVATVTSTSEIKPKVVAPTKIQSAVSDSVKSVSRGIESIVKRIPQPRQTSYPSITPDMHAGRRFTNLVPQGRDLILPIRGEKVLLPSDALDIEEDIQEKAAKLKVLLSQIKGDTELKRATQKVALNIPPSTIIEEVEPEKIAPEKLEEVTNQITEELQTKAVQIDSEIKKVAETSSPEDISAKEKIALLEVEKQRAQQDYTQLNRQLQELQDKMGSNGYVDIASNSQSSASKPVYARIQPLTTKPNVVNGIIRNSLGNIMTGTLIIIKNDKGEAVRAFKSNALGQFSLATPLQDGLYTLEVNVPDGVSDSFDIISLEATGKVMEPLEVNAKNTTEQTGKENL